MDRRYSPEEMAQRTDRLENTFAVQMEGVHVLVRDTVLLGVLLRQLDAYGEHVSPTLEAFRSLARALHPQLVALCAEGPYDGLPVA